MGCLAFALPLRLSLFCVLFMAALVPVRAEGLPQSPPPISPFSDIIGDKKAVPLSGATPPSTDLLPLYGDTAAGKLYLELRGFDREFLYFATLSSGFGVNAVGLDRGSVGDGKIVHFQRVGSSVLLIQTNTNYRAETPDANQRKTVEASFPTSILASLPIAAEDAAAGRVLLDITEFALRDAAQISDALKGYRAVKERSLIYPAGTHSFPKNTEMEAVITFEGSGPSADIARDVAPTAEIVTLREHQSFVALPDDGFRSRRGDPRAGFFDITYSDYATPLGEPLVKHRIVRQRLQKKDPTAALSDPVKPIIYYLDRGVPEPIRGALLEGTRWWNQAFMAAGYRDAFRIELLPEDADPMDARYNVILWEPRDIRGWSLGTTVVDPRTGEIIKAVVRLDALRARYDYLLAEGLLSPYQKPGSVPPELERLTLARMRQLAAHEVGHTLGLAHNFLASSHGRESVMDYPFPFVALKPDNSLDMTNAYAVGIGEWDKTAIAYGYQDFPAGVNEDDALNKILCDSRARNTLFLADSDGRSVNTAHPDASTWDNGTDAADELKRLMRVRRVALNHLGESAIRFETPLATMEEALVPVFLYHRYQIAAVAKSVGGTRYTYALRGDGQIPLRPVSRAEQEKALQGLLSTLQPEELTLPATLIAKLPPRPYTYPATPALFARQTGVTFDAITPALAAAQITIAALLNPERDARLVQQHALDPALPGLNEVLQRLYAATFDNKATGNYQAEIQRSVQRVVVERLMDLAQGPAMPQVRAAALLQLDAIRRRSPLPAGTPDDAERAHRLLLTTDITRFLTHPNDRTPAPLPPLPPGEPLGD